jgi:hypothetical protein
MEDAPSDLKLIRRSKSGGNHGNIKFSTPFLLVRVDH